MTLRFFWPFVSQALALISNKFVAQLVKRHRLFSISKQCLSENATTKGEICNSKVIEYNLHEN